MVYQITKVVRYFVLLNQDLTQKVVHLVDSSRLRHPQISIVHFDFACKGKKLLTLSVS